MLGSQHLRTSLLAAASVDIITWYLPQPAQESVKEIGLSILYLTFFSTFMLSLMVRVTDIFF